MGWKNQNLWVDYAIYQAPKQKGLDEDRVLRFQLLQNPAFFLLFLMIQKMTLFKFKEGKTEVGELAGFKEEKKGKERLNRKSRCGCGGDWFVGFTSVKNWAQREEGEFPWCEAYSKGTNKKEAGQAKPANHPHFPPLLHRNGFIPFLNFFFFGFSIIIVC